MIKCPICKQPTGTYSEETTPGVFEEQDLLLYQVSYKGQPDYLPPRCLKCYEKLEAKRKGKEATNLKPIP